MCTCVQQIMWLPNSAISTDNRRIRQSKLKRYNWHVGLPCNVQIRQCCHTFDCCHWTVYNRMAPSLQVSFSCYSSCCCLACDIHATVYLKSKLLRTGCSSFDFGSFATDVKVSNFNSALNLKSKAISFEMLVCCCLFCTYQHLVRQELLKIISDT